MTTEQFVNAVRTDVVDAGDTDYRQMFTTTEADEATDPYFRNALELFRALSPSQREVFFDVLKQVAVDTMSSLLAILDGKASFSNGSDGVQLIDSEGHHLDDLQDEFLVLFE